MVIELRLLYIWKIGLGRQRTSRIRTPVVRIENDFEIEKKIWVNRLKQQPQKSVSFFSHGRLALKSRNTSPCRIGLLGGDLISGTIQESRYYAFKIQSS